jgi:hypothetical protein
MKPQSSFAGKEQPLARQVPQTSLSPLWTRKQVAQALGLCVHSIARYTRAGLLPCIKLNRRVVRYDPGAVQAFIKSAKEGGR